MSPKMLVRPIRARKTRPHMGHECVGAAVKVEVAIALALGGHFLAVPLRSVSFLPQAPLW